MERHNAAAAAGGHSSTSSPPRRRRRAGSADGVGSVPRIVVTPPKEDGAKLTSPLVHDVRYPSVSVVPAANLSACDSDSSTHFEDVSYLEEEDNNNNNYSNNSNKGGAGGGGGAELWNSSKHNGGVKSSKFSKFKRKIKEKKKALATKKKSNKSTIKAIPTKSITPAAAVVDVFVSSSSSRENLHDRGTYKKQKAGDRRINDNAKIHTKQKVNNYNNYNNSGNEEDDEEEEEEEGMKSIVIPHLGTYIDGISTIRGGPVHKHTPSNVNAAVILGKESEKKLINSAQTICTDFTVGASSPLSPIVTNAVAKVMSGGISIKKRTSSMRYSDIYVAPEKENSPPKRGVVKKDSIVKGVAKRLYATHNDLAHDATKAELSNAMEQHRQKGAGTKRRSDEMIGVDKDATSRKVKRRVDGK